MSQQFIFFYLMTPDDEKKSDVVDAHMDYWKENKPVEFPGGPFEDRSGGLILLRQTQPVPPRS